jgi:hypothetical protein
MRRLIPGSLCIILTVSVLSLFSCTPGSCFEETESYLKATFYIIEPAEKITAPDSLTIHGISNDSILYNKSVNITRALIPLNASTESCKFIIQTKGITDTIQFRYNSFPHLISKECGYTYYHHLDTIPGYTTHAIKSIIVKNSTITNLNVENIRIYY